MASKSQRGNGPSQVRQSMSAPGFVRFVNRTGVVASNINVGGFWAPGSLPLTWSKSDDAASEQFINLFVPPHEYSSVWIKFSLRISETDTVWIQIYADNRVDTPQGKRDIIFSFHHTEEETAQYDNWQSGKKNFTLDMDSSKPDETVWTLDWNYKKAFSRIDWAANQNWPVGSVSSVIPGAPVLPVYNAQNGHMKMFFAMDANRISFDTNPPPTDISPAVIVQLDDLGVVVNLIRTGWPAIARGQLGDTELVLEGFFQPEGSSGPESESCVEPVKFKVSTQPAVSVSTQWRKMRQNMPWGMRGRIHWSIRIPDFNDKRIGLGSPTPVEIYFISTVKLPAFLQRGIPVGLCRKFLLPLRRLARDEDIGSFKDAQIKDPNVNNSTAGSSMSRSISDDEDGWVTYVAEKLHFQPNIQYDSRGGGSAHYWWVEPLGGLWLEAWVSDTAEKQKHVLNCYDLAAFTQAILPLGLTSPAHHVQMWHMDPFGYIKKTHLIGRGESNNPFCTGVGTNDKWVCGDNLLDRSGFGRHKFCTLRRGEKGADLVLDSTCRPLVGGPHAGTETLAEYITNSIDAASDLYKVPKAKWDEFWIATWKRLKRKHDVPGQLKLGEYAIKNTPPNPETRIGVESMFTPPEIFHPDWMTVSKDKEADNMFTFVSDELFADHNVTEPNLVVTGAALTTCWCVAIGEECLSLKISCCAYETVAQDLFRQTKQDLIGVAYSEEVPSEEEAAEHPDDVRTAWIEADKLKNQPKMNTSHRLAATDGAGLTLWVQGNFFVQITKDSSQGLKPVVSELQAFINELGVPKAPQIAVVDATKRTVAHKSTFEIDVSGFSPDSFTPCNVTVQHNKALFLSSTKLGGTIRFKFLARFKDEEAPAAGNGDVIEFRSWTPNLRASDPAQVSISIQ